MSLHAGAAGGNCMIWFPWICIFSVIFDLQRTGSVYPIFVNYSEQQNRFYRGLYLFNMGLGIHRGLGASVYVVAIKISLLETAAVCFSSISSRVDGWQRLRGCGSAALPGFRHASCNYLIHRHLELFLSISLSQAHTLLTLSLHSQCSYIPLPLFYKCWSDSQTISSFSMWSQICYHLFRWQTWTAI